MTFTSHPNRWLYAAMIMGLLTILALCLIGCGDASPTAPSQPPAIGPGEPVGKPSGEPIPMPPPCPIGRICKL